MIVFFSWHSIENLTVRKFKDNKKHWRDERAAGKVFYLLIVPFSSPFCYSFLSFPFYDSMYHFLPGMGVENYVLLLPRSKSLDPNKDPS
jgi:hypothetical protein